MEKAILGNDIFEKNIGYIIYQNDLYLPRTFNGDWMLSSKSWFIV